MKKTIKAPPELVVHIHEMIHELKLYTFKATQVPDTRPTAIEGHNIWVTEIKNPKWYSQLVRKYPKRRKKWKQRQWEWQRRSQYFDSLIVRKDILRTLHHLMGKGTVSKYAVDLLEVARERYNSAEPMGTYVEFYFWNNYRIHLEPEEVELLENKTVVMWDVVAQYIQTNTAFPSWLTDDYTVPF